MCTLTFVPSKDGYIAGMNRDELLTRPSAALPQVHERDGMEIAYPQESSRGTWIACNSQGNLLALLNWNDVDNTSTGEKRKTRGSVIPELISETNLIATDSHYQHLNLDGVFPFRLVGIFWKERTINEWRWDGAGKQKLQFPWGRKHWFSSSLSDASAERERGRICEAGASDSAVGSKAWLRNLHRSHVHTPGPFSICVHRPDAATVSYTEIRCNGSLISMSYRVGNPCLRKGFDSVTSLALREPLTPRTPAYSQNC